jgi:protein-disulfide isomerase
LREEGRRWRPRLVGVIVLAVCGLVLLFVIASLSLDEGEDEPIEIEGAGAVQRLLGGIQQDGPVLGEPEAPVTVQVFNDVQCEPCADYQLDVIEPLVADQVRQGGEVRLEFHHFPMSRAGIGLAAYAAVAAGLQDYEWHFIELFLRNQEEGGAEGVTQELLDQVANGILNFNVEQWQRDMDEEEVREALEADDELAAELGFPAEPAVVVQGPGGTEELIQSPSLEEIRSAIEQVR